MKKAEVQFSYYIIMNKYLFSSLITKRAGKFDIAGFQATLSRAQG